MSYDNKEIKYTFDGREYREKKITWFYEDKEHEGVAIFDVEEGAIRFHEDRRQEDFDSLYADDISEELKREKVTIEDIWYSIPDNVTDWHLQ